MAVRSTNTYQEGLQRLIQDVASMMLLPDGNPDFLFQLQNLLIGESTSANQAQQPAPPPPSGNMMSPDMMAGGMPPAAMMAGQGAGAPMAMPGGGPIPGSAPLPPNALGDEVRRMLQ